MLTSPYGPSWLWGCPNIKQKKPSLFSPVNTQARAKVVLASSKQGNKRQIVPRRNYRADEGADLCLSTFPTPTLPSPDILPLLNCPKAGSIVRYQKVLWVISKMTLFAVLWATILFIAHRENIYRGEGSFCH